MASPVNRRRRCKAFQRGHDRPQGANPYRNALLAKLWTTGRERRLAKTGGVMPMPSRPTEPPPAGKRPKPPGPGRPKPPRGCR